MDLFREPLAIVDLETTGGRAARDRITEVGVLLVDDGRAVAEHAWLVNPGVRIPPFISRLTGIDDGLVADAPPFERRGRELLELLEGRLFIAHNARFDFGFLRAEFARLELCFAPRVLCSARLSRRLFPEHRRHNLDSLVARHGLEVARRHRALDDARAVWHWLDRAVRPIAPERVADALEALDARPLLPQRIAPDLFDRLPDGPGVYRFYDADGQLLYVGQSGDLRRRVGDHFRPGGAGGAGARMVSAVADVRWETTRGVLEARLRESALIKQLRPLHNRQLRRSRELCTWRWAPEGGSCRPPRLVVLDGEVPGADEVEHWGLFRTRRAAREALRKLARARRLCLRRLGLERGKGACFGAQLGHCAGVCCGREHASQHDLRLLEGLVALRRFVWPYRGPVGLRERDPGGAVRTVHVLDRWRWLGCLEDLELPLDDRSVTHAALYLDQYRNLAAALRKARPGDLVDLGAARPLGVSA